MIISNSNDYSSISLFPNGGWLLVSIKHPLQCFVQVVLVLKEWFETFLIEEW